MAIGVSAGEHAAARRDALERIGIRLRWLREAFEAAEPGQHSQAQWARAMRVTPEMLNRIELGRYQAPLHVLQRITYFSGASPWYVLFGAVGDSDLPWLDEALLAAHPGDLQTLPRFREVRAMTLQAEPLQAAPREGRGRTARRRYRPRSAGAAEVPGDDT